MMRLALLTFALALLLPFQPVVGPPCGVPYQQFDPVDQEWETLIWWYVDLDGEQRPARDHCDAQPTPAPLPTPSPEPEPEPELPVRAWLPLAFR